MAALLHDIGHYPFAHVVEHYVAARFGDDIELKKFVNHARISNQIIETDKNIKLIFDKYFSSECLNEVVNILTKQRGFLSKLMDSTIDYDKIDYLKRDCYHCGVTYGQGFETNQILLSMRYHPNEQDIFFDESVAYAVEGFLILQSQMLSGVYWNETIRAMFAMFHRFLDVCFASNLSRFKQFVTKLQNAKGDYDAFSTVFSESYEQLVRDNAGKNTSIGSMLSTGAIYQDPIWRLISLHSEPNPNDLYCCAQIFRYNDPLPKRDGQRLNVFRSIIKATAGSSISGGAIDWEAVKKLRRCYLDALVEKRLNPNILDVLVDIPWGKAQNEKICFLNKNGNERQLQDVSHVSNSIFTDLTLFAAPIRVFFSPIMFEVAKYDLESITLSSLEKYFNPRRLMDATNDD